MEKEKRVNKNKREGNILCEENVDLYSIISSLKSLNLPGETWYPLNTAYESQRRSTYCYYVLSNYESLRFALRYLNFQLHQDQISFSRFEVKEEWKLTEIRIDATLSDTLRNKISFYDKLFVRIQSIRNYFRLIQEQKKFFKQCVCINDVFNLILLQK